MRNLLPLVCLVVTAGLAVGCGKEGDSGGSGAASPSSATPASPLATLDAKTALQETWTMEDSPAPVPFLFFAQQGIKVTASCKKPDGTLDCAALQYLRSGMPTEIAKRELDGRMSAGTKVCLKMKKQLVTGKNAVGTEDGFCKFPDGSMITVGALEQYSLRIIQ